MEEKSSLIEYGLISDEDIMDLYSYRPNQGKYEATRDSVQDEA